MKKILFLLFVFALTACQQGRKYFAADDSLPQQHVPIVRFDSALLAIEPESAVQSIRSLYATYPTFMPIWTEQIMGIYRNDTAYLDAQLPLFLSDSVYVDRGSLALYKDVNVLQSDLNCAFTRLAAIDPNFTPPTVYLFFSGYNVPLYMTDTIVGVGIDMYLGADYPVYDLIATVYAYQKPNMSSDHIAIDIVQTYLEQRIPYTAKQNRLIDQMIYLGSIKFLTSLVLNRESYQIMGWTAEQWQWCANKEQAIWHHMMDHQHLYSTDHLVLTNYLKSGPFTLEISQDSPSQIGIWIGWQIVASYMERHEEVTLRELLTLPAQEVLQDSYYKP